LIAGTSRASAGRLTAPASLSGPDPRAVQRLADIDVAEPGDDALIEQQA
jgi:hypothetical protein